MGRLAAIPRSLGDKTDLLVEGGERHMQIKCYISGSTHGRATRYKALFLYAFPFVI